MSAWDFTGAVIWSVLAVLFWAGTFISNKSPNPRYGSTEMGCFLLALPLTCAAAFCIARLCGAHL